MTGEEVKKLLSSAFPDASIEVSGEGAKFELSVVCDSFSGKRPVARQQMVYAILNEEIASGAIHAVVMNLKTIAENV